MMRGLFVALALALPGSYAWAQVTQPVWPKPDVFWYRRTVSGGHLWLKVDAEHGVREPLFDHQRLAIELTLRSGVEYTPLTLPFADPQVQFVLKYDGSNAYIQSGAMAIEFIHGEQFWRCDLQIKWNWNLVPPTDYECLARRPAAQAAPVLPDTAARVSPDGRWSAFIENHNVVLQPARGGADAPRRLTSDGVAADAWHLGSIRWSADSRTLSAVRASERIWLSESVAGTVKQFLTRGQWTVPATGR